MRISEAATGVGEEMADVGLAMQRAMDKTENMRARAAAVEELEKAGTFEDLTQLGSGGDDIDRQLAELTQGGQVDDELAQDEGGAGAPAARPRASWAAARPGRGGGPRDRPDRDARASTACPTSDAGAAQRARQRDGRKPWRRATRRASATLLRADARRCVRERRARRSTARSSQASDVILPPPDTSLEEAARGVHAATALIPADVAAARRRSGCPRAGTSARARARPAARRRSAP